MVVTGHQRDESAKSKMFFWRRSLEARRFSRARGRGLVGEDAFSLG